MSGKDFILALDQGTTSSRAILFDRDGVAQASAARELPQIFPRPGLVEHDPVQIWQDTLTTAREALAKADIRADQVAAIGIANQRETTVVWNRETGQPIHNAIVWQDRRTTDLCESLRQSGHGAMIQARTGLIIDPYFSATKIAWLLDNVAGARAAAEAGALAFGTIDSWLLWNLTGGANHSTDATNASRTMLFDIHRQCWDDELCGLFNIPMNVLPNVLDSADDFGLSSQDLFGSSIPITGMAGDQQAATVGQACFTPGMIKSTYGTGCFVMLNTGTEAVTSENRMLTTVAYRLDGQTTYALEGSIFIAGAAMQWLRDGLKLIDTAPDSEALAHGLESTNGVIMVPAFTGLGAPYWDADARGGILGLTRDSSIAHIVRAGLEAVCYQTRDLLLAMQADAGNVQGLSLDVLRVDGGMSENNWLMQFLSDILDVTVDRPIVTETTALGAAYLAGLQVGLFPSTAAITGQWRRQASFTPDMDPDRRDELYTAWQEAVARVRTVA
ncbi:MAG: glycerol kinase GlpK [Rhodospirillaceae bacterium]|jgi:glycerol kinase|nr:glycerol kinase GlpK [Rhodospirillaceae bacterium]MBT4043684.1 glycerol kinase GlpK [Rhodospirillaceae bacterium]MBT4686528.1 glycerol kinase GlpK [Rhodospirillaceae bacterium]MBT5082670.1 glycerol kinase GlpK [Rhodospirillaceae bacterium]MBT5524166.1 glycerol kinase GlpK [Rhodospirillaceae bacterium]